MEMLRELTTEYNAGDYIIDGTCLLAFRANEKNDWKVFDKPLNQFSKARRKFITLDEPIPTTIDTIEQPGIQVQGSNGKTYTVNDGKCSCPGFTFRGKCKHVSQVS